MKVTLLIAMSAICILNSGCTLSDNLLRTSVIQPILYSGYWDLKLERHQFRKVAEQELDRARMIARVESDNYSCAPFSLDEEKGFIAGFVDYLTYGGTGNPPPMPPRRYWWSDCEGPCEYGAIQDWFKGFQHGTAVAQASGYRNCVTVPLSDSLLTDTLPIYPRPLSEAEYGEPIETPVGELDSPSEVGASSAELSGDNPPAEELELPAPDERLPAGWEARLQEVQFPVVESSDSDADPQRVSEPPSSSAPASRIAAAQPFDSTPLPPASSARSAAPRPLAPVMPRSSDAKDFSAHPDLIEAQRVPVVRESASESPSLSPPQNTPPKRTSRDSRDDGLIEQDTSTLVPAKSLSGDDARRHKAMLTPARINGHGPTQTTHAISRAAVVRPHSWLIAGVLFVVLIGYLHLDPTAQSRRRVANKCWTGWLLVLACCLLSGCSSLTNPVLNGIPVRKLPPEVLFQPDRDQLQTVPLSLLRQKQPEDYILGAGDVLGVFIAGVFPPTTADQPLVSPPVYFPSQIDPLGAGLPPSLGYPVGIRNDGTLSLPLVDPISLDGLTVEQANERVREVYATQGILQPGRESVMLTLMQPRQVRVLVFRQEVGGFAAGGRGDISTNGVKRGTGHVVNLRAYDNDVVNALANTGGLPGLDAYSGIYIFRGGQSNLELTEKLQSLPSSADVSELSSLSVETDFIPTRWPTAEPVPFQQEDIILNEGDVVLLEARAEDLFYTGGLLPAGERVLPRDYDLDVVEAVLQVSGTLVNGAFGGNNFNGLLIQKGIGNPNPSALTVIRRTPNGGQIPIFVDLNRALVDSRERILVHAGDVLILQETRHESVARYFNDVFNFNVFWQVFQRGDASGAAAVTQLPSI